MQSSRQVSPVTTYARERGVLCRQGTHTTAHGPARMAGAGSGRCARCNLPDECRHTDIADLKHNGCRMNSQRLRSWQTSQYKLQKAGAEFRQAINCQYDGANVTKGCASISAQASVCIAGHHFHLEPKLDCRHQLTELCVLNTGLCLNTLHKA